MSADKLEIITEDLSNHPMCKHGPTLLFSTRKPSGICQEFYACSACRTRSECGFYLKKNDYDEGKYKKVNYVRPTLKKFGGLDFVKHVMIDRRNRNYCHTCNIFFPREDFYNHITHSFNIKISDHEFKYPTRFLKPLDNDKKEAQYFFTDKCLEFFAKCFTKININKVVCLGTPSLHEFLINNFGKFKIKSILLDIDYRFAYFYDKTEFFLYNMFNNYFLEGQSAVVDFERFLKTNSLLLIVDPPFGCRTEPLIQTLKEISSLYKHVTNSHNILPIFWTFPYFMENYIRSYMPEMQMSDYKVNYTNHSSYNDTDGGRVYGSPVRIFSNIQISLLDLSATKGYKFCKVCKLWTAKENLHCRVCKICPSRNGETYRHCNLCAMCVKPKYIHCTKCGRCTQKQNHNCLEYQTHSRCWICLNKGHTEKNCTMWLNTMAKRKLLKTLQATRTCLICSISGHNEKQCPQRKNILRESMFLGKISNIFVKND